MNFLAHLKLSFGDADLMVGNFIADSVRRVQFRHFKPMVVEGIRLHHKIDFFTDQHPVVEESKERLRARHGKYAGVIVDILYDHFLALKFEEYHPQPLADFVSDAYSLLYSRWDELPPTIQRMLPFMEADNWLVNYARREGLERVFQGMSRRASFDNRMKEATDDLFSDYLAFESEFDRFFPLLEDYARSEILRIKT